MKSIAELVWIFTWIAGIVISKGFWSTFFAVVTMGFYSAYLVIETLLKFYGVM